MAAITTNDREWILFRLPTGLTDATFTKNGVTMTLSDMIDRAWSDNDSFDNQKMVALADVLDVLAADERFNSVTIGPFSGQGPILMERARYWRTQAASVVGTVPGSFSSVPTTFGTPVCTEFSA